MSHSVAEARTPHTRTFVAMARLENEYQKRMITRTATAIKPQSVLWLATASQVSGSGLI